MKKAVSILSLVVLWSGLLGLHGVVASANEYRRITFPVVGPSNYSDDFGAPRSGGRTHEGNDIMGAKGQHLISAVDGRVNWLRHDATGNMLSIRDSDGWTYRYIHINNDTPGTDDGANSFEHAFAPGIEEGASVTAGQHVAYLGDSGNAEETTPHLHFEIRRPDGSSINPWTSLRLSQGLRAGNICAYDSNPPVNPSDSSGRGYYILGSDGGVFAFGDVQFHGSTGAMTLNGPIVGMGVRDADFGYWLVGSDGGVFAFGDAGFYGSTGSIRLNQPIVGMAATPSGNGYWLVATDGGVFAFGDAGFNGSTGAVKLNKPIVGMASTPSGEGYWLVASDGGAFAFGDAAFYGSTGNITLAQPIISISTTPGGEGYWMVAADGGMFAFGDASYYGSLPGLGYCSWANAAAMGASADGKGYWIVDSVGSVYTFGNAQFFGGLNSIGLNAPPIAMLPVEPRGSDS